ncbi:Heavy metal translocatin protein [Pleurostoma richardsiae]|uniref:Heavy metal translocatin protein n=1 Tax=Pleurostoma richardsiae TaxID=41990 RepID=A0AA38VXU8_9PEZI|nr:Heavy metal translocatin protein [Pleurostoma richardsiae]
MSAAIAMAPSPAPHDRPAFGADLPPPPIPTASTASKSATSSPSAHRTAAPSATPIAPAQQPRSGSGSPKGAAPLAAKSSPPSASRSAHGPPKIIVKKEPGSPDLPNARHRPRKLDLSKNTINPSGAPATARPLTARDSGGLGIQEVGLACLSPGFVTQDPVMKEQLQRSMTVREQQRHIIEARLQQQSAKGDGTESGKDPVSGHFAAKTPGMSRRNKAPPGLSIVAPSHEQFSHERVIQSAPLGQTFTGIHNPHPLTRHITNQPSKLSNTSHIHHVPATQTNNRLPPIADVFGQGLSGHPDSSGHALFMNAARGPLTSPSHPPPPPQAPTPGRPRDFKSAEEAQAELAGGRPELLPKLVHYGGHQPPTPPSPLPGAPRFDANRSTSKRRTRAEYEDGGSPPLGHGRSATRRGPFGEGRDSPETQRAKKEEFLRLCDRAWDLFHS